MVDRFHVRNDLAGQIRDQKVLATQVRQDYRQCRELWNQVENEISDISEAEKILQQIAWVKTGIEAINELKRNTIEGVNWGELEKIERDVVSIKNKIREKIGGE